MYLGVAASVVNLIFGAQVEGRYDKVAAAYQGTAYGSHFGLMAGEIAGTATLGGLIGIVCWLVIATACRRGRGWAQTAATVVLGMDTVGLLVVLIGTQNDPKVRVTSLIVWMIGVAATIPLWSRQARKFFAAWR